MPERYWKNSHKRDDCDRKGSRSLHGVRDPEKQQISDEDDLATGVGTPIRQIGHDRGSERDGRPDESIEKVAPDGSIPIQGGDAPPAVDAAEMEKADPIVAAEEYSVFTTWQKRFTILAASLAGWFSPMTGSIYFPALTQIGQDLHKSPSAINLTVTTYLVFQGLSPMLIAGMADTGGRRLVYSICFTIYIAANLGLALQNDYVALLILRMLQSAGSSGTIVLANGIVGDLVTSAQRGEYIAYASLGSVLGPSLSPVIGGALSQSLGWHWIFWFLLILSAAVFIPLALFLPETCRKIVGDGSVPPPWTSANITDYVRHRGRAAKGIRVDEAKAAALRKNYKIKLANPISTLLVLTDFESCLLMISTGMGFAAFYAISTAASNVFHDKYGLNDTDVGLVFMAVGGGSLISAFTTGKIVDWNYRRLAKRLDFPLSRTRQTDLSTFPIEAARMQVAVPFIVLAGVSQAAYGWTLEADVHIAGPIVLLFLLGYAIIVSFQCMQVLIVDIYPGQPSAATAANNVVRCLLSAGASAAVQPMVRAMGNGWAYTVFGVLLLVGAIGPVFCIKYGVQWRRARKERDDRRERRQAERRRRT